MKALTWLGVVFCLLAAGVLVFWMSGLGASTVEVAAPGGAAEPPKGKNAEGEYESNPFRAAGSAAAPKLEASETTFNFGIMKFPPIDKDGDGEADGDSHAFVVKNTGSGVLKLARGPSTCQCTMSDLQDQAEVPPGGSTTITITWKPDFPTDEFSKGASIWTNDPALFAEGSSSKDGRILFNVEGKVVQGVEADPEDFSLGTLSERDATKFETLVYSRVLTELQPTVKSTSSPFISVTIEPADKAKLNEKNALSGVLVKGVIEPKLPIGRVNEKVVLETGDASRPEVTLTIEAQRQGPMSIAGRFWTNAYTMIDFQRFAAAKGVKTTLNLYAAKQAAPLELTLAELRPEGLLVTAERDAAYADPDRERYMIHVEVPAGRAPERLVAKDAGFVRFRTNREDVPEVKFHIVYESH